MKKIERLDMHKRQTFAGELLDVCLKINEICDCLEKQQEEIDAAYSYCRLNSEKPDKECKHQLAEYSQGYKQCIKCDKKFKPDKLQVLREWVEDLKGQETEHFDSVNGKHWTDELVSKKDLLEKIKELEEK